MSSHGLRPIERPAKTGRRPKHCLITAPSHKVRRVVRFVRDLLGQDKMDLRMSNVQVLHR